MLTKKQLEQEIESLRRTISHMSVEILSMKRNLEYLNSYINEVRNDKEEGWGK